MATKIENVGTYVGTIVQSAVSLTKKGFPQWVALLKPKQKYVESATEIEHFQKQGLLQDGKPGYVPWESFDEEIVAYLVLYNSAEEISPNTELLNVQQLNLATGWQPGAFDTLGDLVGQDILFRVEFKSYTNPETGKTTEGNSVTWIDNKDASPERQLKTLDQDAIKGLLAKVSGYGKSGPKPAAATPAKPAASAGTLTKPTVKAGSAPSAPASSPSTAGPASVTTAATAAVTTPVTTTDAAAQQPSVQKKAERQKKAAPAPAPKAAPTPPPAPQAPETTVAGLPSSITMDDAWAYVCNNKGDNEDQVVEEAWISAVSEVAGDRQAENLTEKDWAKVRDITLKDLAA